MHPIRPGTRPGPRSLERLGLLASIAMGAAACSSGTSSTSSDGGRHEAGHRESGVAESGRDAGKDGGRKPGKDGGPRSEGGAVEGGPSEDAGFGFVAPAAWNQAYPRPTDSQAATDRAACKYTRGMMPAQTLGPSTALDTDIPIEHIVVLMQENRSFDHYFGHLAKYEATKGITNTIESAPDSATNPAYPAGQPGADAGSDAGGPTFPYEHATALCSFDTSHSWGGAHIEYDKGRNDGFYFMNNAAGDVGESINGIEAGYLSGQRAMWWYDERDLPFHYALYSTFAMADHYHSGLLGPTWPNRMYLYAGTSFGETVNAFPDLSSYPFAVDGGTSNPAVIFDELTQRNLTWTLYTEGAPGAGVVLGPAVSVRYPFTPTASVTQFLADAMAGNLPAVAFVDGDNANETTTGDDEHPPSEIELGQHFVWSIVNAVTTSPNWKSTVLFVTYDENGGFFDHVVPPSACEPDSIAPILTTALDQGQPAQFNQYGFRVPFIAISPYAKKSYVSHAVYSHTSITRFIEAKEKIPALSNRDANEDPFTDLFDWQNPPFMTPPTFPEPTINQTAVSNCTAELTPH